MVANCSYREKGEKKETEKKRTTHTFFTTKIKGENAEEFCRYVKLNYSSKTDCESNKNIVLQNDGWI